MKVIRVTKLLITLVALIVSQLSLANTQPSEQDTAAKPTKKTHEFFLDNGLKIIVREDHRVPIAISQVWYKVGSTYEPPGATGISHIVEHMLFKGTHRVPTGEFSKLVGEYGGEDNAFTSKDYTGYYQKWDVSRLPISFELEADRMINATLPEEEFIKEMKVIMEERRLRTDDNPGAKAWERFASIAYASSSYRSPVIGWMHDLQSITRQQAIDWYKTWYAPNNAILIVVGDVKPLEVLELAKQHFGPLPKKEVPFMPQAREVEPLGERRMTIKLPAKLPNLLMAFNVPSLSTVAEGQEWEVYALRMLAGVLDDGNSARLSKNLKRGKQIAASAGAGYSIFGRGDELFTFSGIPNKSYNVKDLEEGFFAEIEKLKNEDVTADELKRIRAQVVSAQVYQQDSIASQASTIGRLEVMGLSWQLIDSYPEKLAKVTPEQIRQVANKYLIRDRLTVAHLDPQPLAQGQ